MISDSEAKIRAKLFNLLKLAKSSNVHEAALARRMYEQLSQKHGITLDETDTHPSGMSELGLTVPIFDLRQKLAASLITEEFDVSVVVCQKMPGIKERTLFLIGIAATLEPARDMLLHLVAEMDKGWDWFETVRLQAPRPFCRWCNALGRRNGCLVCIGQSKPPKKSKSDFYKGVHHAIYLRLRESRLRREEEERRRNQPDDVESFAIRLALESAGVIFPQRPQPPTEPDVHPHSVAIPNAVASRADAIDHFAKDNFPGMKKKRVTIKAPQDSPSYDHGCRYGLIVALGSCPAIPEVQL